MGTISIIGAIGAGIYRPAGGSESRTWAVCASEPPTALSTVKMTIQESRMNPLLKIPARPTTWDGAVA